MLEKNNSSAYYKLSESQKSIWYLEKAYPGTSLNIVAGTLRLKGDIDYKALEKALNIFVKKSDSMRLQIIEEDGVAYQYISEYTPFSVDYIDFSTRGGLKDLFNWDEATTRTAFDIIEKPLFYCAIFKISADEGGFFMKMHHLISDAWTMGLVTRQVISLYTEIKKGLMPDESPNPSYIEHLKENEAYEKSARFIKDKDYWERKFETLPDMTVLKPQKTSDEFITARRKTMITPLKLSNKIREFCSAERLSVFTLFMSALSIYINRVTGAEDIVLGTSILNRTNVREKDTPGMFVSVAAPVRINVNDRMDFKTFAKEMLRENTDILRHQKYPYNYLIRDLKKKHKLANRLFDIVLSYQNSKFHKNETDEQYVAKWIFSGYQVESLVISINDREDGGNLIIDYDFLTDVSDIKEIEFIHAHIISLLWHALDNPFRQISKLEMISEKEKYTILHEFNNTYADYPRDKTIHQIFEEQAAKTPDKTAVVLDTAEMTYRELNEKANRLAHTLRARGVGPDKIVGIMTYRSVEMLVGILAIIKAGGAYLPIDPDYPEERKSYMLKNSCTGILLAQRDLMHSVGFNGLCIDLNDEASYSADTENPAKVNSPKDLSYVIYTSGSTGQPKGVMIEHTGVVNRINWMQKNYPLDENSRILQKTTFSFDVSVWELFWWSFVGASVCLLNPGDEKDPEAIIQAIEHHNVTTMHFVPSMLSAFLNHVETTKAAHRLASLTDVFTSGEALTMPQVELFNALLSEMNRTRLANLYGPTEATVDVSYFNCSPMPALNSVPIGKPIDNISLYILDKNLNLLPVGIPGELYIGGVGVARGYLYNPELTAEKFIINPFKSNEILYKTGDLVRWYPKGDIEFLGRTDYQVKISGFRIELGEIEAKLLSHEAIREAVVKAFKDENDGAYLAAYIVAEPGISSDDVRGYLAALLPNYMVPALIIFLDKIPLSANGKADRKALPSPDGSHRIKTEFIPPANETESVLADIWCRIFGLTDISVLEEYATLGGNSLNAIRIITEIQKILGVQLSPKMIFQLQTIRKLASHIDIILTEVNSRNQFSGIPIIEKREWYPVSAPQKRQFILNQIDGGVTYNLPGGMLITGPLDKVRLENSFKAIIQRHETLRTSFETRNGDPVQVVSENVAFHIEYDEGGDVEIETLMESFIRPFDLGAAPLLRVKLVRVAPEKHLMLLDMHHIISDGASINVIADEFARLYGGEKLPELPVQYKDYTAWHKSLLGSKEMKRQEDYWVSRFKGEIPVLNLPVDTVRPPVRSDKGHILYYTVDTELTAELKKLAAASGTTLFMLLFTAFSVLLSKYTGQDDIVIGTPIEGRRHEDLYGLIGMFANTLAIRSMPDGEKNFKAFLSEIRDDLLNAYDNQDYPFEELVEKTNVKRDLSRNPLFDVLFVMQNMELSRQSADGIIAEPFRCHSKTAKFDLSLEASDQGETISFAIEFSTDLFRQETIERLTGHYENLLRDIAAKPDKKLRDINILSASERRRLLHDFNDTDAGYPADKTIHGIFEEQAEKTPEHTALIFKDQKMTYRELNEKANKLAHTLRAEGVGPDVIVGILCERSFEMLAGILAILKAGGAYLPIDPEYPEERVRYTLENSGAKVLLTQKKLYTHFEGTVFYLDDAAAYSAVASNLPHVNTPADLAYIIYTSGSSGKPKGVMIEHRNVVRLLFNDRFQFDFSGTDVWTLFHSFCFDFSVWEMYGALLYGGKLVIVPKEDAIDTWRFLDIIRSEKVTVLNQTPSAFYNLIRVEAQSDLHIPALRYVVFGGEALKPSLLRSFKEKYPDIRLINMYGITETTVHVTFRELKAEDCDIDLSNVGKPIPTLKTFIVDKYMNPQPVGVPGEICVSGSGVARGYLRNKKLTDEKFVINKTLAEGLIYKSGDRGRYLPNGDIEYIGRIDNQVKIRGFRIELSEIENALQKNPMIEEALVTVYETSDGDRKICAYIKPVTNLTAKEIIASLSNNLPSYMIPSYFINIDAFPLNRNGKIDKTKLPLPGDTYSQRSAAVLPRNSTEQLIADVWAETLHLPIISIDDNFFELGGDSLSAIKIVSLLNMGIKVVDFYTYPTIRLLSEKVLSEKQTAGLMINMTRRMCPGGLNIICFPYGGGNALAYKDMSNAVKAMSSDANLYAVNLPGHEFEDNDPFEPFYETARKLAAEIQQNISGEILLYGHCVGSALMLATAKQLEKAGVGIKGLYIGGIFAPRFVKTIGSFYKPWGLFSNNYLIKFLKKIGLPSNILLDEKITEHITKAFRHDTECFYRCLYSWWAEGNQPLGYPVHIIVGDKDITTRGYAKRYKEWCQYFKSADLIVLKNAYHYFINTHADDIINYLLPIKEE